MGSTTPIVPLFVGSESVAFKICREALDMGLFVTPAIYPAVPPGHALIRTSVTPAHKKTHLDQALEILGTLKAKYPIPYVDPETLPPAKSLDFEQMFAQE
jgi:8-amino-7-oxononanoate synthase